MTSDRTSIRIRTGCRLGLRARKTTKRIASLRRPLFFAAPGSAHYSPDSHGIGVRIPWVLGRLPNSILVSPYPHGDTFPSEGVVANVQHKTPDTPAEVLGGGVWRGGAVSGEEGGVSMRFGTLFSGIGAPEVAWSALGWSPVFAAEVEAFPSAVLAHHYPDLPNLGDITEVDWRDWRNTVDVLIGGSPCQSFSVAGLRGGLDDPRGNLTLEFLQAADRIRSEWLVWENVPGVLSHDGGRSFGAIVGALGELGYGWAYRVLDAQYFGVAQRRRRVFLVGSARGANPAAAVLFEPEGLCGDSAPSREPGERSAPTISARAKGGDGLGTDTECDGGLIPFDTTQITSKTNRCQPRDGSPCHPLAAGAHAPAVAFGLQTDVTPKAQEELAYTLKLPSATGGGHPPAVCITGDVTHALNTANNGKGCSEDGTGRGVPTIHQDMAVRRLTPTECERLQGFPDGYTVIPWRGKPADKCPDGPRYKALGNSMAVPVVRWIGERIEAVQRVLEAADAA